MWSNLKNYSDGALLVVRVSLALIIIFVNGWPKLAGGSAAWSRFAVREMGLTLWPAVWGFVAAMGQTVGCFLLILGLFFRPSALLLMLISAIVAVVDYQSRGLGGASHALELTLFFLLLFFTGPGRFSIDKG
jgi:putative oxidoreductase